MNPTKKLAFVKAAVQPIAPVQMDCFVLIEQADRQNQIERTLSYLRNAFDGYPYHENKDPRYFTRLFQEFSGLDIEEELKQYHAWVLDQDENKKISYRSRFRTWLKTAVRFKSSRGFYHYA